MYDTDASRAAAAEANARNAREAAGQITERTVGGDICNAIALTDFPCSPDVSPQYASQCSPKKGEMVRAVTQYRINKKTGEAVFCQHGGSCYPRYLIVDGQNVEALRLTNCKIGARWASDIPGVIDEDVMYSVDVDRSRNSAEVLKYNDLDNALLALGMCSACAGNAAHIYMEQPQSRCGSTVANALAGDKGAIAELESNPEYCVESASGADVVAENNSVLQQHIAVGTPPPPAVNPSTGQDQALVPRGSERPSFDCAQAKTAAARLICADGELARLDGELGVAFQRRRAQISAPDQSKFISEQLAWIRDRNTRCELIGKNNAAIEALASSKPCMLGAIQERIAYLAQIEATAAPAGQPVDVYTPPQMQAPSPPPVVAQAQPPPQATPTKAVLSSADLPNVVKTYHENEIRFKRDFFGKRFSDVLPFRSATVSIFSKGTYRVGFGTGSFSSDIDCKVTSQGDISVIVNWNKGDNIHVEGIVSDVTMGSVQLDQCTLSK